MFLKRHDKLPPMIPASSPTARTLPKSCPVCWFSPLWVPGCLSPHRRPSRRRAPCNQRPKRAPMSGRAPANAAGTALSCRRSVPRTELGPNSTTTGRCGPKSGRFCRLMASTANVDQGLSKLANVDRKWAQKQANSVKPCQMLLNFGPSRPMLVEFGPISFPFATFRRFWGTCSATCDLRATVELARIATGNFREISSPATVR